MAKTSRLTPVAFARRLELMAAGIRCGRRELIAVDSENWVSALGYPGETIKIEVTRPLTIGQRRGIRRRRRG